jgi:hypothetical protein
MMSILSARTPGERDNALVGFMLLPTIFMPNRMNPTRIHQHLVAGRAFEIDINREKSPGSHRHDSRDAVSRSVERLCFDYQVGKAVKLMQANAETDRPSFETMFAQLRDKFPPIEDANRFDPEPASTIDPFSEQHVLRCVQRMSKSAATAIDGWSRHLLLSAMRCDFTIARDLGVILAWLGASHANEEQQQCVHFSKRAMDIVRVGRLAGIPKPGGGVRPIVISSFIAKLAGAAFLKRANVSKLDHQWAIGRRDGAKHIIHRSREAFDEGKCIIRLDSQNAFNITKRIRILEQLKESSLDKDLITYFSTMYQPASKLVVYGQQGRMEFINSSEGVRQGDALSSFYFCIVMRKACVELKERHPEADVDAFMDDTTIAVDPQHAVTVLNSAIEIMEANGFRINTEKSAMICKQPIPMPEDSTPRVHVIDAQEPFKMLGANITDNYVQLHDEVHGKILRFFDSLDALTVHPEVKHTILHLCGRPKLLYFAETTPPHHSLPIVTFFQQRANESFAKIIRCEVDDIDEAQLYSVCGANMPNYIAHVEELYNASRAASKGAPIVETVRLVENPDDSNSPEGLSDGCWSRFVHPTRCEQMSPALYEKALAIRCKVIPRDLWNGKQVICECMAEDGVCNTSEEIIRHATKCEQMSKISNSVRHSWLKYALASIARCHGIGATVEPCFYTYEGTDVQHRPDICFIHHGTKTVTDVTIVTPIDEEGTAAQKAADEKSAHHKRACEAIGHDFIPFAMETTGLFDKRCITLIKKLAHTLPNSSRFTFFHDMRGAASTAIATFRATAVINAFSDRFGTTFG